MRNLTATICLTIALLFGSAGVSWSADFQKGFTAYESGDYATARREWKPLAEQGHAIAQFILGVMYEGGQGVPQDYKTVVKWYSLAAEQGIAIAQLKLGLMHHNGQGVPQDYKTAVMWWKLAAEQGNAGAQVKLGGMHGLGKGVLKDYVYAHMWANIAASNGDESGRNLRDLVAEQMTPADISAAQTLARECVRKNYKGC
jgi:TPR repeat protein